MDAVGNLIAEGRYDVVVCRAVKRFSSALKRFQLQRFILDFSILNVFNRKRIQIQCVDAARISENNFV